VRWLAVPPGRAWLVVGGWRHAAANPVIPARPDVTVTSYLDATKDR
jgi:hypothetical protein